MVNGMPKKAEDIGASDSLTIFTNGILISDAVDKVDIHKEEVAVYNIEVEHAHTYFTDNMILHHNKEQV